MTLINHERQLDTINQNIDLAINMMGLAIHDPLRVEHHLSNAICLLQHQKVTIEMLSNEIDMME